MIRACSKSSIVRYKLPQSPQRTQRGGHYLHSSNKISRVLCGLCGGLDFKQALRSLLLLACFYAALSSSLLFAETNDKAEAIFSPYGPQKEKTVTTSHTANIDGKAVSYDATVGTQMLRDESGKEKGLIFYTAYTRTDINQSDASLRPLIFCFNGGPGSASVWLHLGAFGPKRVNIDEEGLHTTLPFHLVPNPYSLLDIADLVFIDPISTGYSRVIWNQDPKQFYNVDTDVETVAEFIRVYTTRQEKWTAPKFVAGESYGTTRAVGLALELHDKQHLFLNGVILISSVLNHMTLNFGNGNDLVYTLYLPAYTKTALYYHKLSEEMQNNPEKALRESREFAYGEYAESLFLGDRIDPQKRKKVIGKLAALTGLSPDYIEKSDLRVSQDHFAKELLRSQNRVIGRFDSRYMGIDSNSLGAVYECDPSFNAFLGLFTATFNDYVRRDLGWKTDEEYKILANVTPWGYNSTMGQTLNVSDKLQEVMDRNNRLRIYVAGGTYDLATPYFATEYTFSHLGLLPSLKKHIELHLYEGGHMMYLNQNSIAQMKLDLSAFIRKALKDPNPAE